MADKHFKVKNNVQVSDLTTAGPVTVDSNGVLNSHSTLAIDKGGTGQTTAANAINALLPSQTNNTNKVLASDGTNVNWVNNGAAYQTSAPSNPNVGDLWVDSDETGDSLDPFIIRRKTITATAGQTVFTTDVTFTDGYEQIYYNGVLLVRTTDYTTSGGTNTVTLLQGASAGDTVEIIASTPINLINTVTTNSANTITAPTASSIPLKVVGASSQTADLFEALNSSNGELFAIRSNGRVKTNVLSTEVDTQTLAIHANANNSSTGTSVILWGKDMNDWGGDVHYLADSRGVSGAHRFWNWDGTNFLHRAMIDKNGNVVIGTGSDYGAGLTIQKSGTNFVPSTVYPYPSGRTFLAFQSVGGQDNWFGFLPTYATTSGSANMVLAVNNNNFGQQAGHYVGSEAVSATASNLAFGRLLGGANGASSATKNEQMRLTSDGNLRLMSGTGGTGPRYIIRTSDNADESTYLGKELFWTLIGANNNEGWRFRNSGGLNVLTMNAGTSGYGASMLGSLTQNASDKRLKTNIEQILNAVAKVNSLTGVTYNWNELANELVHYNQEEREVGLFAQDLQEVLPEAVKIAPFDSKDGRNESASGENYLTIQYEKVVPLLVEAIKELAAEIEELKNK